MSLPDRFLYYGAALLIIGLVGLRLFHLIDPAWGMNGVLLGTLLLSRVYTRQIQRLTKRNEELEEQLAQQIAPPHDS